MLASEFVNTMVFGMLKGTEHGCTQMSNIYDDKIFFIPESIVRMVSIFPSKYITATIVQARTEYKPLGWIGSWLNGVSHQVRLMERSTTHRMMMTQRTLLAVM